ncbi:ADP-ribosylation factor-like protein [Methanobacterium subterraneum]|nr:ADP-ribosylation factor-like protein [Methanobacterium subterraneum]
MKKCKAEAIPRVIVANKQDLPDSLSPEEIRKVMNMGQNIPIIPVSLMRNEGIEEALDALLEILYR